MTVCDLPDAYLIGAYLFCVVQRSREQRFRASNGEVMFSSEGYKAKASAQSAIESIRKNAPDAGLDDQT